MPSVTTDRLREQAGKLLLRALEDDLEELFLGDLHLGGEHRGAARGIGIERETASRPSYAVSPWDATTLAKAIFQPTHKGADCKIA